jgi:FkbM family methyltransferase
MNATSRIAMKLNQRVSLMISSRNPIPLLLDSVRLQLVPYKAALADSSVEFDLEPHCGDWFTFFECCIRKDYLREPIHLKAGDAVLDIGGNFGAFSIMAAKAVGESGRVHSYEPYPVSFDRIRKHVKMNALNNVSVFNSGVAGVRSKVELHISDKSAFNSIYAEVDGSCRSKIGTIPVDVVDIQSALREIGDEISLAKIDCEGAEYDIFDALDDSDILKVKQFGIETHGINGHMPGEIKDRLLALGYRLYGGNPFLAVRREVPPGK